jgi:hypothetical protein
LTRNQRQKANEPTSPKSQRANLANLAKKLKGQRANLANLAKKPKEKGKDTYRTATTDYPCCISTLGDSSGAGRKALPRCKDTQ